MASIKISLPIVRKKHLVTRVRYVIIKRVVQLILFLSSFLETTILSCCKMKTKNRHVDFFSRMTLFKIALQNLCDISPLISCCPSTNLNDRHAAPSHLPHRMAPVPYDVKATNFWKPPVYRDFIVTSIGTNLRRVL
jgi:hypothetical protein